MQAKSLIIALMIAAMAVASPIIVQTADDVVPEHTDFVQSGSDTQFGGAGVFNPYDWSWTRGESWNESGHKGKGKHAERAHAPQVQVSKGKKPSAPKLDMLQRPAAKTAKAIRHILDEAKQEVSLLKEPSDAAKSLEDAVKGRDWQLVEKLVNAGADVDTALDAEGRTALMMAVQLNDGKMVDTLIKKLGANPMVQDTNGKTAFDYCPYEQGASHMVQRPAGKGLPNVNFDGAKAILHQLKAAVQHRKKDIMRTLVNAAKQEVSLLREPSHSAKATSLKQAVQAKDCDLVEKLVNAGTDVDAMLDTEGRTALMMAVQLNDGKMVDTLMKKLGANPMVRDMNGKTAFDYCPYMEGASHMVQRPIVANAGKGFRKVNFDGAKAIMQQLKAAAKRKKSIEATALKKAVESGDWLVAQKIIQAGADVNAMLDHAGHTALMLAVQRGDSKMVQVLTVSGANVMVQDRNGKTATTLDVDYALGAHQLGGKGSVQMREMVPESGLVELRAKARFDWNTWYDPTTWFSDPPPPPTPPPTHLPAKPLLKAKKSVGISPRVQKALEQQNAQQKAPVQKEVKRELNENYESHASAQEMQKVLESKTTGIIKNAANQLSQGQHVARAAAAIDPAEVAEAHSKTHTSEEASAYDISKALKQSAKAMAEASQDLKDGKTATGDPATDEAIDAALKGTAIGADPYREAKPQTQTSDQKISKSVMKEINSLSHDMSHDIVYSPPPDSLKP